MTQTAQAPPGGPSTLPEVRRDDRPHPSPRRPGGRRRAPRRTSRPLLVLGGSLLVVGVVVLVATAWLGIRGGSAAAALEAARADLEAARLALQQGDVTTAEGLLASAQQQTGRARAIASDPVVAAATHLPFVGSTPRALRAVAPVADDVTHGPLAALVRAAAWLDPQTLRPTGSRIDVDAVRRAVPELRAAVHGLDGASAQLAALDAAGLPAPVHDAVDSLAEQLDATSAATASVARAVSVLPAMLGADGPRTYFLALQSNNEVRGTGGFFGAYGVVEVDDGQLRIRRLAPSRDVADTTFDELPVPLGRDYAALYGDAAASWTSANLSPHFPDAARLWQRMYQVRSGTRVDGVIAVDPVTLGYLLSATGPLVLPDGRVLDAAQVVPFTENQVYGEITDDAVRDEYLQVVARSALRAILGGGAAPGDLLAALQRGAAERRVLVWSDRPEEEAVLAGTSLGGAVPRGPGPFAGLALNNASGNKMDYYLQAGLDYRGLACRPDGSRVTRTTVTLTNTALPGADLPSYVSQRGDLPPGPDGLPRPGDGSYLVEAQVYATAGSMLTGARLDGRRVDVATGTEQGKAVFRLPVHLRPGATRTLTLDLVEPPLAPGADPAPRTFVTPLVLPASTTVGPTACPTS